MVVPDPFALRGQAAIAGRLRRHGFALPVKAADGAPQASHLPFLYQPGRGPKGRLTAHLARANPQAAELERLAAEGGEALVVFQGPHVSAMIRGILAFEIPAARLDAKAKLNQNEPAEERLAAAAALRETGGAQAREVAALMESPALDP